jgi:hypothetical protein
MTLTSHQTTPTLHPLGVPHKTSETQDLHLLPIMPSLSDQDHLLGATCWTNLQVNNNNNNHLVSQEDSTRNIKDVIPTTTYSPHLTICPSFPSCNCPDVVRHRNSFTNVPLVVTGHGGSHRDSPHSSSQPDLGSSSAPGGGLLAERGSVPPAFYQSHNLRSDEGKVSCPVLREYNCPICNNGGGDNAHTIKYCPLARNSRPGASGGGGGGLKRLNFNWILI